MTGSPNSPMFRGFLTAVLGPTVAVLVAACSTAGANGAGPATPSARASVAAATASAVVAAGPSTAPSPAAPSAVPSALTVTSSVGDGALTSPVEWIATVSGASSSDPIDHVDFLVDGKALWTEHAIPYQFNDDGNLLMPAVLSPGSHRLSINAVTASGASATTQATVTTSRPPVPAALLGKTFGQAQPGGGPTPDGTWLIRFGADGVISFDDPGGSGGNEGFTATPDGGLTLYGPANWVEPKDRQGGFCDSAEGVAKMHWQLLPGRLELSAVGADPCSGRSSRLSGTWTLKP